MLTNVYIAKELDVKEQRVSDWKNGVRGISTADARKINFRLGIELSFIIYGDPQDVLKEIIKILERQI